MVPLGPPPLHTSCLHPAVCVPTEHYHDNGVTPGRDTNPLNSRADILWWSPNNKHCSRRLAVSGSAEATPEVQDVVTHVSRGQWTDTSTARGLTQEPQRQPLDAQWGILVDDEPQTDGADPGLCFGQDMSLTTGLGLGFAQTEMRQEWPNGEGTHFLAVCETGGDGTVNPQDLMVSGPSAAEPDWSGGSWNRDGSYPTASPQETPDNLAQGGFGFGDTDFTAPCNPPGFYSAHQNAYCPASASIPGAPVSSVAFSDVSRVLDE
jgi:hypothetical protein